MKTLFTDGWQFAKLHFDTAEQVHPDFEALNALPDSAFSPVAVPHDWLIWNTEDLYENSIGVYRNTFLPPEKGMRVHFRFEGVYMDTTVFINGTKAFEWKYGYTTFQVDATSFLHDGMNTITVISVYRSPNTRWYSGAGIYRDVWMVTVPETHLVSDGVYFSAHEAEDGSWIANVSAEVAYCPVSGSPVSGSTAADGSKAGCAGNALVRQTLLSAEGDVVASYQQTVQPAPVTTQDPYRYLSGDDAVRAETAFSLTGIHRWDIDDPYLYTLKTELFSEDGALLDSNQQQTGFRTIRYDKDEGFFLNGRHVKLHGACMHHDLGALGAAFNLTALKRQFAKLRAMGVNAIRTSHNPPAEDFMKLADETGMLIDSECFDMWEKPKTQYDYGNFFNDWHSRDTASWIRRDRNHPCVIMWSIGNEIYDTHQGNGLAITRNLVSLVHRHDPLRNAPITIGSNYMEWDGAQSCADEVDLAGYNYTERLYAEHHRKHPDWCIYGSETSSTIQSRGIYHFPASFRTLTHNDQQCSSLGNCSSNWGAINTDQAIAKDRDAAFCAGQFIWTGWDYIGEPTPYFTKNSYFGQIDTAGFEKDTFYLYQAEWTDADTNPMVHLLPYWDFNVGQLIDIRAYTNAPSVELLLNGKSQGVRYIDHEHGQTLSGAWQLPYEKGTITAIARDSDGTELARESHTTPEDPVQIVARADKAAFNTDERDLIFIEIHTADRHGNPVPNARNRISVSVTGAVLEGLDNGDSTDYEQYKCNDRKLFNNALTAILSPDREAPDGPVTVRISSPGMEDVLLSLNVASPAQPAAPTQPTAATTAASQPDTGAQPAAPRSAESLRHASCALHKADIPVRKIELASSGPRSLSPDNVQVSVTARILPENATYRQIRWQACRIEGIESKAVQITADTEPGADGLLHATIHAVQDGEFRLRCTADNGTALPEITSELEFSVSGLGTRSFNPYRLISACEHTAALHEPKLSFQGGVYVLAERNWLGFDNVDFGTDGADEFTIPIFSFDTSLPLEMWDGNPDDGGRLLMAFEYSSPSWYNHYQANTWKLPRRLYGIHDIYLLSTTRFSIQGFSFTPSVKALSFLPATDADTITGDSFIRKEDGIYDIGNNVSLDFQNMNFGSSSARTITIRGRAVNGTNSVHLILTPESSGCSPMKLAFEVPRTDTEADHTFTLDTPITGNMKVSFMFLPGSRFDFKGFIFGE